jgi:hypothetical protein
LAQLITVCDDYAGSFLLVDDVLAGDACRQFLGRSGHHSAEEREKSECQDRSVHDLASPLAFRLPLRRSIWRGAGMPSCAEF